MAFDAPEDGTPLRDILGNVVGEASEEREAMLRALRSGPAGTPDHGAATSSLANKVIGVAAAAALAAVATPGLLASMFGGLLGRKASGGGSAGSAGSPSSSAAVPAGLRPEPAWKQRLMEAAARLATGTGLSTLFAQRQAAYLRKVMEMLEQGDIHEALRHAIPLDDSGQLGRQALGTPGARTSLEITPAGGTAVNIGLSSDVTQYLRTSYRQLFERLDREGRIDEATFVLAELLKSGAEAVDYLERKERMKQAAQLAESLQLGAPMQVRLWILAGDAARAVRIARLHGAFAEAVRELELRQRSESAALRLLWAEYLADRGDVLEAVEAIWPLQPYRELALRWLREAEHAGRVLGARALVRKLSLLPDALAESAAALTAMFDNDTEEGPHLRALLATEIIALKTQSQATRRLTGELVRYLIADRSAGRNELSPKTIKQLLLIGDASMLQSDLPPLDFRATDQAGAARKKQVTPDAMTVQAPERGLMQVHDVRRLPDGQYLVALGEGGVLRLSAYGKQLAHYRLPASDLIVSANGQRALGLARRGNVVRASRIDLVSGKAADWLSLPLDFWAAQFDGVVWNAVINNRIVAIDTTKDQLSVIWQVADLPGKILDFADDERTQTILRAAGEALQQWRYMLPARRLSQRDPLPSPPPGTGSLLAHGASTAPLQVRIAHEAEASMLTVLWQNGRRLDVAVGDPASLNVEIKAGWLLVHTVGADALASCRVFDAANAELAATVTIPDARSPGAAACGEFVWVFDRCGRLVELNLQTRTERRLTLN